MRKGCQTTSNEYIIKKNDHFYSTDSGTGIDLLRLQISDKTSPSKVRKNRTLSRSRLIASPEVEKAENINTNSGRREIKNQKIQRSTSETKPPNNSSTLFPVSVPQAVPRTLRRFRKVVQKSRYTEHWSPEIQSEDFSLSHHQRYSPHPIECPPDAFQNKMSQRTRTSASPEHYSGNFAVDSFEGAGSLQTSEKKSFPFQQTPSGNLKIVPNQVVFQSKKVSVLVADPNNTRVNVQGDLARAGLISPEDTAREEDMEDSVGGDYMSEDFIDKSSDVLVPEIKLERLGICNTEPFNWDNVTMHGKTNLYEELSRRITNYVLADCTVEIGNEEFSCHLIVLQSYSKYFESVKEKKVDLTQQDSVSPKAFATIYGWMITHPEDSFKLLTRDNCLELFSASKYLQIKELEEQCWLFIDSEEVFNEETAFLLFMEAKRNGQIDVMQLMIPRIRKFFLTLVSSQDFLELSAEEVCAFLSSNYIYINCEMEVLMSAVRWLRFDWKSRQKYLVDLMRCVRFGWIEPWQLIDVKRNPENPEFIAIMKNPDVLRMVDDGLAFVIIKYWYGHKNDDFQHWLDLLGLEEPGHRNLSGEDKNYVTFRQFLEYLDTYRNEAIMEKSMPKGNKKSIQNLRIKPSHKDDKSEEILKRPIPTMDEMLASRKIDVQSLDSYKSSELNDVRRTKTRKPDVRLEDRREKENQAFKMIHSLKGDEPVSVVPPQEQRQMNVMSMYGSTHKNMNELSASCLGHQKNLLNEGSLFAPDRETVLVFGGIDPHSQYGIGRNTGKDVYRYVPETNTWEFVTELPEPRHHHAVTFLKGRVYLVGGADPRDDDTRGKSVVVSTVWSFEPVHRSWFSESGMNTPRKNLGLVVTRQKMFAIGGQDRLGRVLSSVERYEPDSGVWVEVAPLKSPRMGIAAAKYRDYIWVAGGMTGSKKTPLSHEVECYDTRTEQWTQLTNLRFPRCFGRLFVVDDSLYLIGGAGRISDKDKTTTSVEAIDVWCNKDKEWRLLTEMAIPRHGHAVAYIGTQILMIGGVTTVYMRALSNVECYCVERCTWVRGVAGLPTTLSGHGAVTLPPASLM